MMMHALPALGALATSDGAHGGKDEAEAETFAVQSLVSDGTRLVLNPGLTHYPTVLAAPFPAHPAHCPSAPSFLNRTPPPNIYSYSSLAAH